MGARTRSASCSLLLVLTLFVFSCSPVVSNAADTLAPGQSFTDGESLVSAGEEFHLGFFSPGRSNKRYLGIWFSRIPTQTVIWVANRGSPVPDSSGSCALTSNGSLLVLDGMRNVLWSSNTSAASSSSTGASAQLLDSGNLVVTVSGTTLWQTFDHPGDTFVPGMSVGLDLRTRTNTLLTSWRSEDDPSPGSFSIGIDPRGLAQIVMWEGSSRRWRSGQWNGQTFTNMGELIPLNLYGPRFSNGDEDDKIHFMFVRYNSSYQRFVLRPNGAEEQFMWDNSSKAWSTVISLPSNECELYNRCGAFGVCNSAATPMCSCLRGYEPRSAEQWSNGNWSGGCVRRLPLRCERGNGSDGGVDGREDGFFMVEGVSLPDVPGWNGLTDVEGCRGACLRNCTCKAYAYTRGIGCMLWSADLVDMHRLNRGGYELYIRLPGSELVVRKQTSKIVTVAAVLVSVFLFLSIYVSWKYKNKIKGICKRGIRRSAVLDYERTGARMEDSSLELLIFLFESLSEATSNFSDSNILGEGGFGPVYKGKLSSGQEIAVKRLSKGSGQGLEEFKNEVVLIAKLQHRNLVRLLGCCIKEDEKMLVYEYMPNKSLDTLLFDSKKKVVLDWKTRFNIIHGIARGLLYLHQDSRLRIIHRDLKASNILLDDEMNPKISDFGLARTFGGNQNEANTKRVVGTFGYMAPEYAMDGIFSIKSDVYSFGVLLLEIVSGKKNKMILYSGPSISLLGDAWHLWNEKKPMEFVDPVVAESSSPVEVLRCMHIGLLCVQSHAFDRPTMASVVLMLGSEATSFPTPAQPIFITERSCAESSSSTNNPEVCSTNEITITILTGR